MHFPKMHRLSRSHVDNDTKPFKLNSPLSKFKRVLNSFSRSRSGLGKREYIKSFFHSKDDSESYYAAQRSKYPSYDRFENVCRRSPIYDPDMRLENEVVSNRTVHSLERNGEVALNCQQQLEPDLEPLETIRYEYVSKLVKTGLPYPDDCYTVWEVQPAAELIPPVEDEFVFDTLNYKLEYETLPSGERIEVKKYLDPKSLEPKPRVTTGLTWAKVNEAKKHFRKNGVNNSTDTTTYKNKSLLQTISELTPLTTTLSFSKGATPKKKVSFEEPSEPVLTPEQIEKAAEEAAEAAKVAAEAAKEKAIKDAEFKAVQKAIRKLNANREGLPKINYWAPRHRRKVAQEKAKALGLPMPDIIKDRVPDYNEQFINRPEGSRTCAIDGDMLIPIDPEEIRQHNEYWKTAQANHKLNECHTHSGKETCSHSVDDSHALSTSENCSDSNSVASEKSAKTSMHSKNSQLSKRKLSGLRDTSPLYLPTNFDVLGDARARAQRQYECDIAVCRTSGYNFIERIELNSYDDGGQIRDVVFYPEATLWTYEVGKSEELNPKLVPKHQRGNMFRSRDKSKLKPPTEKFPFDEQSVWQMASNFASNYCTFGTSEYTWANKLDSNKLDCQRMTFIT
ncbi:hypothetical protein CLIB1423_07S06062 [[Candida] railenensis]|uniref:Uncharacterized protein n=1 Tax=[Candida] railenensis TaxID=45579 RepID=A0A9P0VY77_9ASCO|nr:hypothetical protein CLIB1423_07S06062 [[Candida] railenensis]